MPHLSEVMEVAVVISPTGGVTFTLKDQTSVNTAIKAWRSKTPGHVRDAHKAAETVGGVIVIKMFAADFHAMEKHIG